MYIAVWSSPIHHRLKLKTLKKPFLREELNILRLSKTYTTKDYY